MKNEPCNNDGSQEIELSYGELTIIKLEEFFACGDKPYSERKNLYVPTTFWDWRKENKSRASVLNKAGLLLSKGDAGWTADLSEVTADTLDTARDANIAWKRTEKELKDRANIYMRQCERARRREAGETGLGLLGESY